MNHTINQTEYKDSAVGRTPASWEVCQLSSILELKHGYQFRTPDFRESGIKVVKIGQVIGDGKLDLTDCDFISEELAEQKREFLLSAGDILMSLTGNIGRVGIVPDIKSPLIQNYRVGKFAPVRERVEQNFLSQLLGSNFVTYQLETSSNMTAQANFGKSDIDKIKVKLPPLAEQQKIASILTSVDEVIEKIESQISKLQDLKKGMMQELLTKGIGHTEFKDSAVGRIPVGWEVVTISELLKLKNGLNTNADAFGSGVPFLSYKDVSKDTELNEHSLSKRVTVNPREAESFSVNYGDIFFTRTSETPEEIGFANTYLGKNIGAVFNGFCIRGRPVTDKLSARLCRFLFRSDYVRVQMKFLCKYTTRAGISGESLERCLLALPPLAEQKKIASTLSSIDTNIQTKQQKLQQTQNLKKSLMQDLLTGKVRVSVN